MLSPHLKHHIDLTLNALNHLASEDLRFEGRINLIHENKLSSSDRKLWADGVQEIAKMLDGETNTATALGWNIEFVPRAYSYITNNPEITKNLSRIALLAPELQPTIDKIQRMSEFPEKLKDVDLSLCNLTGADLSATNLFSANLKRS